MHFQVEKARRSSRISLISLPLLCSRFSFDPLSHLLASSPSLKKDNLSPVPEYNSFPRLFHTLAYFFYPFSSWRGLGRGRLLACLLVEHDTPSPSLRREKQSSARKCTRERVPSAPLIKSLMRLPIEGGR